MPPAAAASPAAASPEALDAASASKAAGGLDTIEFGRRGRPGKKATGSEFERRKICIELNKISESNYDSTKRFMQDFLDPSDTKFLTIFVKATFETAASSVVLCKICTRLLCELAEEHPHVRSELHRMFAEFMLIFDDTIGTPEVNAVNYPAFLEAQIRKRARRGYSRFIAELVLLKELPAAAYLELLEIVTRSLVRASTSEDNQNECVEYADCLKLLFQTAVRPSGEWLSAIAALAKTTAATMPPGMTSQARFALLDIVDRLKL